MSYVPKHEARASLLAGHHPDPYSPYTAGGYHQREGYAGQAPAAKPMKTSWRYLPNSRWTWAFALTVIFQAAIAAALECYIFARFEELLKPECSGSPVSRIIPTYLSLFIFGFLYQILLTYDALRLQNTIQVIGLCIYNIGLLIEAAVQLEQFQSAIDRSQQDGRCINANNQPEEPVESSFSGVAKPFVIAVPIIIAVFTFVMAYEARKLYEEFAWSIYKHISADLRLKKRYLDYQIYIALLKFDFFFFLAFTVQFLVAVPSTSDVELGLTIAAIPITIALLFMAAYWVRKENLWGMLFILVIYLAAMAYFLFKLFRMYFANPTRLRDYLAARHTLTTFAVLTLVLLVVTIAYAVMCTLNFNKGLKPYVQSGAGTGRRKKSQTMNELYPTESNASSGGRMTIE